MYIWFARKASLTGWLHRTLLVLLLLVMMSQIMSKPALAVPQQQEAPKQ